MIPYDDNGVGLLLAQQAKYNAARENQGRTATASMVHVTHGIGEIILGESQKFNLKFLEQPRFTSGIVLGGTLDPVAGHFPRAGAGVYGWDVDGFGHYVGAYLFFTVDTVGPNTTFGIEPNYTIEHHLCFTGRALKELPAHLLDF